MATHTPTPWTYQDTRHGFVIIHEDGSEDGKRVAQVDGAKAPDKALLLLAAPELLKALKELVDLMDCVRSGEYKPDSFTCQPAQAAIAQAEGRR